MSGKLKKKVKMLWGLLVFGVLTFPVYAQQAGGNVAGELKKGISLILGVMFLIAFPWGVVTIWQGAQAKKKGDPEAHNSIIAGVWIAGAALIMGAIFAAFGLSDAVSAVEF